MVLPLLTQQECLAPRLFRALCMDISYQPRCIMVYAGGESYLYCQQFNLAVSLEIILSGLFVISLCHTQMPTTTKIIPPLILQM